MTRNGTPVGDVEVQDLNDVRVSQRRHDVGLLPQAGQVAGLPGQAGVENLDRDLAAQPLMGRHVDVAAPALGKRADDAIAAAQDRPHRRGRPSAGRSSTRAPMKSMSRRQ